MFNSLPDNFKKKIRSEYNLRLLIVALVAILIIQGSFLVLLIPSWIISLNKEGAVISESEKVNTASLDSKISSANAQILAINTKLQVINTTLQYPKVIPLIDGILIEKTKDIKIKELVFSSKDALTGSIVLSGVATTRDALVSFAKSLEETRLFKKIDLPISNLTKDKDISFSINMTIAP